MPNPIQAVKKLYTSTIQQYPPLGLAIFLATFMFVSNVWSLLIRLSVNSDNPYWGYDYFGLPRCGMAILKGLPIFGSVVEYGPWATPWISHPMLCLVLGIPLSQFNTPNTSYHFANSLYFGFHLFALLAMSRPLCDGSFHGEPVKSKIMHFAFATLVGFFVPYLVVYHYAQYHAVSVLAMTLVLLGGRSVTAGFVLSALSKPLLAPAGIVLIVRREWKKVFWITILATLGSSIWLLRDHLYGFTSGSLIENGATSSLVLKYSVLDWNQEMSLAKAFETFLDGDTNYHVRTAISVLELLSAAYLAWKGKEKVAIGMALLVFYTIYARGHEYHATTLIPFLIFLFAQPSKVHRNWFFVAIVALFSLPTSYPIMRYIIGVDCSSIQTMKESSPLGGWLFVLQRPVAVLGLWLYLLVTEVFVSDSRAFYG